EEAEPPRIPSRSEAAKRRRSDRAIPGAPRQRLYCSVSLRAKRRPGGGALTSGGRTRVPFGGASAVRLRAASRSRTNFSWPRFPAAATTTFPPTYIDRWYARIARRLTGAI